MSGERLCGIIFSNEIFAKGVLKMEKAYKTMKTSGAINIALGVVVLVLGLASGILMIASGGCLLKNKRHIVW